ncbi:hypothetical protein [Exiguobacterium sp. s22]|uniref:NACHT domain-containing protein n=1 Tax=Exiguobacterium sp. s22 TaxID=2751272 RepID=UPI001BE55AE8|nr:hypothetical protein [Exiguobacterium sp. s22]
MRLSKEEAYKLLSKYDTKNIMVDRLIKELELKSNLNVTEFLENPLMVSLLFKAYKHKNILPFKKNIFYRQVYDALYNEHDLSKGGSFEHEKKCKLDSDKFHTVLRTLGFLTLKDNIIAYSKDQIIDYLNRSSFFSNIEFQPSLFLSDLILTVPLFTREGIEYKWNHKSFQEYFATQFICKDAKEKQKDILINMYNSNNFVSYLNVLDLCYDIDYKTFRNVIIYNFLNEIINYSEEFDIQFKKVNKFSWRKDDYLKMKCSLFLSENYLVTNLNAIKEIQESNNKKTNNQNKKGSHSIFKNALDYLTSHNLDDSPKYPVTFIRTIQNSSVNEKGIECDKTFLFVSANSNKKYFIRFLIDKKENIFYNKVKQKKQLKQNFNLFKIDFSRPGNHEEANKIFNSITVDCQKLNLDFLAKHNKFAEIYDYLDMIILPSKIYGTKLFDFDLIEAYKNSIEFEMKEYNASDLTKF